jgi:hypothetical protein
MVKIRTPPKNISLVNKLLKMSANVLKICTK